VDEKSGREEFEKLAMEKTKTPRKTLPAGVAKVLTQLHYPVDVILLCVCWYVAYSPSTRNLEEMMAERGFEVDIQACIAG
jgi:transposase-like protein